MTGAYPDPRRVGTEIALARGLEAGGYYNTAKLLWALAYSDEIRRSEIEGVPKGEATLVQGLKALQKELEQSGAPARALDYLKRGLQGVEQRGELGWHDSGDLAVCRSCGTLMIAAIPDRCPGCGAWKLTFRVFLPVHFLEPLEPETALKWLKATPKILGELMAGLDAASISAPPAPGEWSMREAMHHFLLTEGLLSGRVRQLLEEDRPRLVGVSAWAAEPEDSPAEEMLARFRDSRRETVDRLAELNAEQWMRVGDHDEFGPVTLLQQASYFARHDHSHLAQVEAIRRAITG
ncbi:MAG TPA: DinB family protein [Anaerolineales bacterium]|nr:DinB family protein [Anaerolineales bacterium]